MCTLQADMLWTRPSQPVRYGLYYYKAMLLPDAIPMIFPLSKKAVKAPTKKRGAFFKARKTQGTCMWPFSNTPMHNPVHFRAKRHVHTMLTISVFMACSYAVIFHINKTTLCLILYPGKTNIKTLNLSHYACACFEFSLNDENFDSTLSVIS